ncbi:MAG TPA: DUF4340 domain-containing protein, partial [Myxococcales bacterium]
MSARRPQLILLASLSIVAAGLGLYAYFGVMKTEERETQRKERAEKIFASSPPGARGPDGGAPADPVFTSIEIKAKDDTTALEKKEKGWRITAPVSSPADSYVVDQVLGQLRSGKLQATVEENPTDADLLKYGLKEPKFSVTAFAYAPDARKITLHGGIENPFDGSVYVQREGDKAVYVVDGSVRFALEKSTFDLRDKDVLAVDEPKLQRVDVKTRAQAYSLERNSDKTWRLVAPRALPADTSAVNSMLSGLRGAKALAFLPYSERERARLGLDAPSVDATFVQADGGKIRIRLVAASADGGGKAYALREDGSQSVLAEIPPSPIADLSKNPLDLRDRSVLIFKQDQVAKIVFSPGGSAKEIAVEKIVPDGGDSEEWVVVTPEKGPAKRWKISSLLYKLASLKAASVVADAPVDFSKYGISGSSRGVGLFDATGKELARLEIGKDVKDKPGAVYLRGSRNQVLQMD